MGSCFSIEEDESEPRPHNKPGFFFSFSFFLIGGFDSFVIECKFKLFSDYKAYMCDGSID